jgi:hypothetical protein
VSTDYDEVRQLPGCPRLVTELDGVDALDEGLTPGGEIVSKEVIV